MRSGDFAFMSKLNRTVGKVIANLRREADSTQEALAFECDLHPTYISQIERGLKSPTIGALFLIAKALNKNPSSILAAVEKAL